MVDNRLFFDTKSNYVIQIHELDTSVSRFMLNFWLKRFFILYNLNQDIKSSKNLFQKYPRLLTLSSSAHRKAWLTNDRSGSSVLSCQGIIEVSREG